MGHRPTSKQLLFLFRGFFPSWKFFDTTEGALELFSRSAAALDLTDLSPHQIEWSSWQPCLPKKKRSLKMMIFNPQGNLHHANDTLVQHLKNDSEQFSPEELESTVAFQLVKNLVALQCRQDLFQFKVSGVEDLIISPIYRSSL